MKPSAANRGVVLVIALIVCAPTAARGNSRPWVGEESEGNAVGIEYQKRGIVFAVAEGAAELTLVGRGLVTLFSARTTLATPLLTPEQIASLNQLSYTELMKRTGGPNLFIIALLLVMWVLAVAIAIGRFQLYRVARDVSRGFAPRCAQALKNDRIEEAISLSAAHSKSHLATVVNAYLQEIGVHENISEVSDDEIKAGERAPQRAIAFQLLEFKRGLLGLTAISSTASLIGLLGLVFGLIQALQSLKSDADANAVDAIALTLNGLLILALGFALVVLARWRLNSAVQRVKDYTIEMENTASEIISYI